MHQLNYILLGSTNPSKAEAIQKALPNKDTRVFDSDSFLQLMNHNHTAKEDSKIKIFQIEVDSKVSKQPMSNQETKQGAVNRARQALEFGLKKTTHLPANNAVGLGIESGIYQLGNQWWTTGWVALVTQENQLFLAQGASYLLPEVFSRKILKGQEMAIVVTELCGDKQNRSKQGLIGILTDSFLNRADIYAPLVKMVLGFWFNYKKGPESFFYHNHEAALS